MSRVIALGDHTGVRIHRPYLRSRIILQHESGTSVRGRPHVGCGGNARVRTVVYMATLSASRHNPAIQMFYTRLRKRGKAVKVARCAAARKLLHVAWSLVTKGQVFAPHYQPATPDELVASY